SEVALINISMAGPDNRVLATVIRRLLVRGTPVVAAVGNGGPASPMLYPAGYPGVIGVTAVGQNRKIYRWANQGQQVDFAAAGVDVAVAVTDGQYGTQSGTSLAAPVISGQLACALADTSFEQALTGLKQHGIDLGDSGRDPVYGYGLVRDSY
ncbi:S8 family serine peptidase, partial [Marinobacter alexandrii]|uniref:S8 family serine peptidase n=1 Tax=Marinobacter alexandrii TaxID=2570351 RepID=UPI003298BA88